MEDNVLQVMKDMKSFFNLSLSAIGFFAIANFLRWLAPKAFETATWPNLGKIYEEYFSMLYGILFGVFILVLCARLNLLRAIVDRMASEENATGLGDLKYFPWIASPYLRMKYGSFSLPVLNSRWWTIRLR